MSERTRRAILERRAAFVAAAVATLGAAGGCEDLNRARACLSAVPDESAKGVTPPADASLGGTPDVGPQPCLTEAPMPCLSPPPLPPDAMSAPCLSIARPRDAGPPKPKACLSVLPDD